MDDLEKLLQRHRTGKRYLTGYNMLEKLGYKWGKETADYIMFSNEMDDVRIFIQKKPEKNQREPHAWKGERYTSSISRDVSWTRGAFTLKETVAVARVIEEEKLNA